MKKRLILSLSGLILVIVLLTGLSLIVDPAAQAAALAPAPGSGPAISDIDDLEVSCALTVMNTDSSGPGTLREAISNACDGGLITFDAALSGGTINLSANGTITGELTITKSIAIHGTVPITISGNNDSRVFNVTDGNATFDSLTIANGNVQTLDCGPFSITCGGGIILQHSGVAVTVTHSTISGNSASHGSGIFNLAGDLTVTNSTLSGNSTTYGGGIHSQGGGKLTVTNSTISGNSATSQGGGINMVAGGLLTVTNSTISGNSATSGGGIYNSSFMNLTNTIIASNSGGDCIAGILLTNSHNLVKDGSCNPALSGDPMLGPLADNGGPTLTQALLSGSPAIDAGDCSSGPATDQRGVARPQNNTCDIGAFEIAGTRLYLPMILR